jgi:hypothetical protein
MMAAGHAGLARPIALLTPIPHDALIGIAA